MNDGAQQICDGSHIWVHDGKLLDPEEETYLSRVSCRRCGLEGIRDGDDLYVKV